MNTETVKTPKKPKPTDATMFELAVHHNHLLERCHGLSLPKASGLTAMPTDAEGLSSYDKNATIVRIRNLNRYLGRTIRRRALELLEERIKGPDGRPMTDADGRSVGMKYNEVLEILRVEFPEASTSVACLRWYIVHLKTDANDLGLPWPNLPQVRPRAKLPKAVEPRPIEDAA
jgi:hypothetical protein